MWFWASAESTLRLRRYLRVLDGGARVDFPHLSLSIQTLLNKGGITPMGAVSLKLLPLWHKVLVGVSAEL